MSTDTPHDRVSLRDLIEQRFDSLDRRLDAKFETQDAATDDHETRIRSLEKRITWSNVVGVAATAANAALALIGIKQ